MHDGCRLVQRYGPAKPSAGAGMEQTHDNCTACHSAGMILNQPDLPRATWEVEVPKMIATYKAPVDESDVGAIVN